MVVALAASGWWAMCRRVTGRQSPSWPLCAGVAMRAPQTIDGSRSERNLAYVEQCLAPTLKPKHIVMIDNLPAHKAIGDRVAIEARGATFRYLPKYSPDLNPMEMPSTLSQPSTNDRSQLIKCLPGRW